MSKRSFARGCQVFVLALLAGTSGGSLGAAEPPDSLPVALRRTPPVYPEAARRLALSGTTSVRLTITPTGRVARAGVAKSSGYPILDDAAVACTRGWTFAPAHRAGQAVEATVVVPLEFEIQPGTGQRNFFRGSDVFAPIPPYPERARRARDYGRLVIGVKWNADGTVASARVLGGGVRGGAGSWWDELLPFVRAHWRLKPTALKRYQPGVETVFPVELRLR